MYFLDFDLILADNNVRSSVKIRVLSSDSGKITEYLEIEHPGDFNVTKVKKNVKFTVMSCSFIKIYLNINISKYLRLLVEWSVEGP